MPVKMSVNKAARTTKPQAAKKPAKKITQTDIEANFARIQKSQNEAWQAIRETKKAQDEAWAAIRETQQTQKAAQKTTDKYRDEAWAAIKYTQKHIDGNKTIIDEAWTAIKETQKNIGGINNTLGLMVERIMTPALPQKFKPLGFSFDKITTVQWAAKGNIYAELDGLLENGTQAMVVEVKTTLEIEDVNDHINRMDKVRKYADDHGDKREFLGAIAAMVIKSKPKEYALKNGFFIIEPSGDDVKVTKPEGEVRVW